MYWFIVFTLLTFCASTVQGTAHKFICSSKELVPNECKIVVNEKSRSVTLVPDKTTRKWSHTMISNDIKLIDFIEDGDNDGFIVHFTTGASPLYVQPCSPEFAGKLLKIRRQVEGIMEIIHSERLLVSDQPSVIRGDNIEELSTLSIEEIKELDKSSKKKEKKEKRRREKKEKKEKREKKKDRKEKVKKEKRSDVKSNKEPQFVEEIVQNPLMTHIAARGLVKFPSISPLTTPPSGNPLSPRKSPRNVITPRQLSKDKLPPTPHKDSSSGSSDN